MKVFCTPLQYQWQWELFTKFVPVIRTEDTTGIFAFDENAHFLGATVFDNWTPNSVQAHSLILNPLLLRHGFMELCFGYVFNKEGRKTMYGLIPSNNEKAISMFLKYGGTEVTRLDDSIRDGVGCVIMKLTKEDCKYLPKEVENGL